MEEWINYLGKVKMEVEAQDPTVVISKKQHASKTLRGARLAPEKRARALFNASGVHDPIKLETVLRVKYPRLHDTGKRLGQFVPRGRDGDRKRYSSGAKDYTKSGYRSKPWKKKHAAHEVDDPGWDEPASQTESQEGEVDGEVLLEAEDAEQLEQELSVQGGDSQEDEE